MISFLVIIQLALLSTSFVFLIHIQIQEEDMASYVNIAGKNRFFTVFTLHELSEFTSGSVSSDKVDNLFAEFYANILLLKEGGKFLDNEIKPLPVTFSKDLTLVEENFNEFKLLYEELKTMQEQSIIPTEIFYIKHERIENELITAADDLTNKITLQYNEIVQLKQNLEIILPIINGLIYVVTIIAIFKILKKDDQQN